MTWFFENPCEALGNWGCCKLKKSCLHGRQVLLGFSSFRIRNGFGHLVNLNAVLKVFPVVAIVGGKPFASNAKF